eukprot:7199510-Karenia_brevis.AAC.1
MIRPAGKVDRKHEATGFGSPKGLGVEGSQGAIREGQGPPRAQVVQSKYQVDPQGQNSHQLY